MKLFFLNSVEIVRLWELKAVESATEVLVVSTMIDSNNPLSGLEFRELLILDNPVAGVASLTPPDSFGLVPLVHFLVKRCDHHVLSELSDHVALIDSVVDVVVLAAVWGCLLADDPTCEVAYALGDEAAWLGNHSDVGVWEQLVDERSNLWSDFLEVLG
jgi:hypothetical protein